ncbi:MAG: ATP-binding protein [Acidobacteriota bacterium]
MIATPDGLVPSRVVLVLVLLMLAGPSPGRGDFWYEHYQQAEKALASGNWVEAITQLNEALERRGDSGVKVRTYGMHFTPYFPHLKLGIAYYELGEMDAALQAFETEELLEAIKKSDAAWAELESYRRRALAARDAAAEEEQQRILDSNLQQARDFQRQGNLDEAIRAVSRGLAVAPDDAEALSVLDALRRELAQQQEESERQERAAGWTEQGRSRLAAGELAEAASAFQKSLALVPSSEVEVLLTNTQQRLRGELAREQLEEAAAQRAASVAERLRQAGNFESSGELSAALAELQAVLALDARNPGALAMQTRILERQSASEREAARQSTIRNLLAQADADFGAERSEASLSAANRVLALEPDNTTALAYVVRAYRRISQDLLGTTQQNTPPAIRFTDLRQDQADGTRVQGVTESDFQLNGLIIDESPVTVSFFDRTGRQLPGTSESRLWGEYHLTQFHLQARLRAGLSTFRLTAVDEEGKSSMSEYEVSYEPPLHRRVWFYPSLAVLPLALLGAFVWRRQRQRHRLRQRRFNPYVAGAPVLDQNLFIGRDRLIDRILQTVHNNSLLLYGERRIGKTSLQHHLKRRLLELDDPQYDFFPAYIDLQGTPEDKFFATVAEDTFQELESVLDGLPSRLVDDAPYTYRDLVRDLREVLKVLKAKSTKRVKLVLLIDEVDELNEYDPKINQKLRSLFMKSFAENLVAVVSGVAIKKQWEREGSPWYNFFEEIEVKAFQRDDARELIEKPIRGLFDLEDGLVERIIEVTDGKPYLIQKLCIALVNRLYEQGRRAMTLADLEAIGRPEDA